MNNSENDNEKTIRDLRIENDRLKDDLLDLTTQLNYSKENELMDFVRTLYREVNVEIKDRESKLTKKEILLNIKNYLLEFAKNNRIRL